VLLGLQVARGTSSACRRGTRTTTASIRRAPARERFDQKSLLVKFKAGAPVAERKAALARHGGIARALVHGTPFSLVKVADAARVRQGLEAEPAIATVELNHTRYAFTTPNHPRFGPAP